MTKEEQWKREAEINLDELDDRGFDFDNWSISDAYERGYCDCAESKEKQIAGLEKENSDRINKAKEIIKILKDNLSMYSGNYQKEIMEAEKFLSEG